MTHITFGPKHLLSWWTLFGFQYCSSLAICFQNTHWRFMIFAIVWVHIKIWITISPIFHVLSWISHFFYRLMVFNLTILHTQWEVIATSLVNFKYLMWLWYIFFPLGENSKGEAFRNFQICNIILSTRHY